MACLSLSISSELLELSDEGVNLFGGDEPDRGHVDFGVGVGDGVSEAYEVVPAFVGVVAEDLGEFLSDL